MLLDAFVLVVILGAVIVAARRFGLGIREGLQSTQRPDPTRDESFRNWQMLQQTTDFLSSDTTPQAPDVLSAVGASQPDTSSSSPCDSGSAGFDSSGNAGGGFGGGGGDAF